MDFEALSARHRKDPGILGAYHRWVSQPHRNRSDRTQLTPATRAQLVLEDENSLLVFSG